jgi:tetratricopeptide (TPR) repeat protein
LPCPDENKILAFTEGRLGADDLAAVEAHTAACRGCQELLSLAFSGTTTETPAEPRTPRPRRSSLELERGASVGRYTVLHLAGRGGMSEVYAAYDPELDRKIALKLLHAEAGGVRAESRLLREAKAIAKLTHPNVISVYDAGDFEHRVFLAMEFVEGKTLAAWIEERPRTRDEILSVCVEAARGLAAAHAAGLVHRDFKPQNVMVGDDGAVRVMDFGLVRQLGDGEGALGVGSTGAAARESSPEPSLTLTGELLGTPLFMAPEQFQAKVVDARADQFSFCVTLYRALYGAHPFDSTTLGTLMTDVLAGRVKPPPPRSAVPSRLRQVLLRGLSVEPAARWPSMAALVAALTDDPTRRRRRALALAGGLLAGVAAIVGVARASRPAASLCLGGPARLAGVWEPADAARPDRRHAVRAGLLATGAPYAEETWRLVASTLDGYATRWLGMYRDACEATQVRGEQSATVLDLRMSCLDGRREALLALGDVLRTADGEVVKNAVDAANGLPPLERCADAKRLLESVEPPRDPATRARVDDLRKQAAVVNALHGTGKQREAVEKGTALLAASRALQYRPLLAEALETVGRVKVMGGGQGGPALLEEAVWTGIAARRLEVAASAASMLVGTEGYYDAKPEEGERWSHLALALVDQMGGDKRIRAWTLQNLAAMRNQQGRRAEALALIKEALAIKETFLPPDSPDIGLGKITMAESLAHLGDPAAALREDEQALQIFTHAYGPNSTQAAMALNNIGEYLSDLGRHEEALQSFRRALPIWEVLHGPRHPFVAYALTGIGRALVELGHPDAALKPLERALEIRLTQEPDAGTVAETRFALALALWRTGGDPVRAGELARRSLEDSKEETQRREIRAALASRETEAKAAGRHGPRP